MALRDGYSQYGFFMALSPQDLDGTAVNGNDIDTRGYETVTFVVTVGNAASAGAMSTDNQHEFILAHADDTGASAAGTYTACASTDMIRNASGAVTSGVWQSIGSYTDSSTVYQIGYKGKKRWVRLQFSGNGAPSVMSMAAICILGKPANWNVNTVG
jgi:hypothetical protein